MTSAKRQRIARQRCAALLSASIAAATPLVAFAANTDNFTGTSGQDWNTAAHWNNNLVPGTGDTVNITETPTSLFSVTFDSNYTALTAISSLTVDGSSSFGVVLNQGTAGDFLFATNETIGNNGIGTFNQSIATNTLTGTLFLGNSSTGQGNYLLSGGSLIAANADVGNNGHGVVNQSGGSASISGLLSIGANAGSVGLYSLGTAGSLTVGGYERVGYLGTGTFIQTGGIHNSNSWLFVGSDAGDSGTYSLSGSAMLNAPQMSVGYHGTGVVNQTGGTLNSTGFLNIGDQSNGTGTYNLSAGLLSVNGLTIANAATGSSGNAGGNFLQTGGTNSVSGVFTVGNAGGSNGLYSLGPAGSLTVSGTAYVGYSGSGTFVQSGGSAIFNGSTTSIGLSIGDQSTGAGTYSLSAGSVTVANTLSVGTGATGSGGKAGGSFIQTGGSVAAEALLLSNVAGASGYYSLSGTGSLNTTEVVVGYNGAGTFLQSGGTNTETSLYIASNFGTGTYSLSGAGNLSASAISIGQTGIGSFNQSGGTVTGTGYLTVGDNLNGSGSYTLSGGLINLSSKSTNALNIGYHSPQSPYAGAVGSFMQSGGSVNTPLVVMGVLSGATGSYSLSGSGLLTVTAGEEIGSSGSGVFTQSGGTHSLTGATTYLYIGHNVGSNGSYSLSGTGNLSVAGAAYVGSSGTGIFTQSGGTADFFGNDPYGNGLIIGDQPGAIGTYSLSGGNLSVSNILVVGNSATGSGSVAGGTMLHSAGTANLSSLSIGNNAGSTGLYSLSNMGSIAANVEEIGVVGTGTFAQSGGDNNLTNGSGGDSIYIGITSSGIGTYSMSGGTLETTALNVGYAGFGLFNQTGGTVTYGGSLELGFASGSQGTYNLSAGSLNVNSGFIGERFGSGTFIQSGGTFNINSGGSLEIGASGSGSYTLSGTGILINVNATYIGVVNSGTFVQTGGTATLSGLLAIGDAGGTGAYSLSGTGKLIANASIGVGGTPTASSGTGSFTISGGSATIPNTLKVWNTAGNGLTLSGGALNVGVLDLSGNTSLFNWTGGTLNFLNGATVDSNFLLGSSLTLQGTMNLSAGATLTNNGSITLAGGGLGGTGHIVNSFGEISGYGTIGGSGGFANASELAQSGGVLNLSNTGSNTNTGNIDLAIGSQFQLSGGALVNTGTINLNGVAITGTAQLNNGTTGVISGSGTITAPLANTGTITLSSGTLTLPAFTNNGGIAPNGVAANISGAPITNAGYIQGFGNVNNNITNNGTIQPTGNATLRMTGSVTNSASGFITATTGNEVLFTQGLGVNSGLISLTGGTIDTDNTLLTNSGNISGYGILRTGSLINNAELELTGGTATVNGNVINNSGGRVDVKYTTAVFNSPVTNNAGGTFKITGGNVSFVSTFTNNGIYSSDPADNYFAYLTISTTGALIGGVGDRFFVSGDFDNSSTQNRVWNTGSSLVDLEGAKVHNFRVAGVDEGSTAAGYVNNFAVGILELESGGSLSLQPASADSALYVETLQLDGGLNQVSSIAGNGANIYYDPANSSNEYLRDQSYTLSGGGEIAPVPEPAAATLIGIVGGLLSRRRRSCVGGKGAK